MKELPPELIIEILSRLSDQYELALCSLVCREFHRLSRHVKSINVHCSFQRYAKSRCPLTAATLTPLKSIVRDLVSRSDDLSSVTIGVERSDGDVYDEDDEGEQDDLYLTDVNFVRQWLLGISGRLMSISITDFWIQSCWRRSEILSLISSHCQGLQELELKNAWLSLDGLNSMPKLTMLTLEFIRLDDEDLEKLNACFPSLQVLNLIGVGGLREPRIHLLHLKTCKWTVSNAPSSITLIAPNLDRLILTCVRPNILTIEAPLLSDFRLSLERAGDFKVKESLKLRILQVESPQLCKLLCSFPFRNTITSLAVDSLTFGTVEYWGFTLQNLLVLFPAVSALTLGAGAWSKIERHHCCHGSGTGNWIPGLKKLTGYLTLHDIKITLSYIFFVLEKCVDLSDVVLFINRDVCYTLTDSLRYKCMLHCARVRWRWGVWSEGVSDPWL